MLKNITIALFIILITFTTTGCSSTLYDAETLHQKGAHLTKITRKVKVAIRKGIADENLSMYINKKYHNDMQEFSEYSIQMKSYNKTAIVLMCDKDKTKALLEDLSCTGALEGGYMFQKDLSCDFHLDIESECKK